MPAWAKKGQGLCPWTPLGPRGPKPPKLCRVFRRGANEAFIVERVGPPPEHPARLARVWGLRPQRGPGAEPLAFP
jgi:hypothetical protein